MRKQGMFKSSLPINGSGDRIVLMFWATSAEHRFQNIARVDRDGAIKWRAELPGDAERDCFVGVTRDGDAFTARTYAGHVITFDTKGRVAGLSKQQLPHPQVWHAPGAPNGRRPIAGAKRGHVGRNEKAIDPALPWPSERPYVQDQD